MSEEPKAEESVSEEPKAAEIESEEPKAEESETVAAPLSMKDAVEETAILTGAVKEAERGTDQKTGEQIVFGAAVDFFHAIRPMITYILCATVCLLVGYLFVGGGRGFWEYTQRYGNFFAVLGTIWTFRRLSKKSKAGGSAFFEDASLYHTDLSWKKTVCALFFGIGMALFLSAVLSLLPRIGPVKGYVTHVGRAYQQWDVFLSMAASVLFTPLVEEIIFRGYMLNRLLQKWREMTAVIVTTVIFALMHGSFLWFVYAFCMGYVLARLSIQEDNIFYGIFLHAGFNLPSTVLWLIYVNVPGSEEVLASDKLMITLLGTAGGLVAMFMWQWYKKQRKVLPV